MARTTGVTRGAAVFLLAALVLGAAITTGTPHVRAMPTETVAVTRIVINTPAKTLTAYAGDRIVLRCPCAIGRPWTPSPTGIGVVINRKVDPTWRPAGKPEIPPGPNNPLGKRWLGLSWPGYGIHGTNVGASVGTVASHGCIRLSEADILWLFDHTAVGTEVDFVYQPVSVTRDGAAVTFEVHPDIYGRGVPSPRYLQTAARRAGVSLSATEATTLIADADAAGVARLRVEPTVVVVHLADETPDGRAIAVVGERSIVSAP